jgi:predicted AAA+ superfamily ATPase
MDRETLYPRIFQQPKNSFFLFGPRGTGKTTLIESLGLAENEITLLDEERYQAYLARPGLFFEELSRIPTGKWVFIDEIQRLPALLNEVHRLIEKKRLKFAMSGSSARKLRRAGVNLLAGRAVSRFLYPLTPMEMGKDFDLDRALEIGTLPLVIQADDPDDTLKAYVQTYLKDEIQAEALVRNLAGFSRFLPVAALFHAQTLNLSGIARDAGVQRPTVQGFFEILQDTLLTRKLEAYSPRLRVREKKTPKLYFMDPGIVRALKKARGPVSIEERGPLFEGLIFMLLSFQKDTFGEIDDIHYWAPAEAKLTEVDFILSKGADLIAIEAKSSESIRPEDLKGLRAITELKGIKRRIVVYRGKTDRLTEDGIEILGFDSFIQFLKDREI